MKVPSLSVRINKNSLRDVYQFLQGVSRYIGAIYISRAIVDNSGLKAVNTLVLRYPQKRIIFELLYTERNFFPFFQILLEKTNVVFYAIIFPAKTSFDLAVVNRIQELGQFHAKTIYFFVNAVNYHHFVARKITNLGYYKTLEAEDSEWSDQDSQIVNELATFTKEIKLFNISNCHIKGFYNAKIAVSEIVAGSDVIFSFNPVESCKRIYATIKNIFFHSNE